MFVLPLYVPSLSCRLEPLCRSWFDPLLLRPSRRLLGLVYLVVARVLGPITRQSRVFLPSSLCSSRSHPSAFPTHVEAEVSAVVAVAFVLFVTILFYLVFEGARWRCCCQQCPIGAGPFSGFSFLCNLGVSLLLLSPWHGPPFPHCSLMLYPQGGSLLPCFHLLLLPCRLCDPLWL